MRPRPYRPSNPAPAPPPIWPCQLRGLPNGRGSRLASAACKQCVRSIWNRRSLRPKSSAACTAVCRPANTSKRRPIGPWPLWNHPAAAPALPALSFVPASSSGPPQREKPAGDSNRCRPRLDFPCRFRRPHRPVKSTASTNKRHWRDRRGCCFLHASDASRSRFPSSGVSCTPAFTAAVRRPLRPRLRVHVQNPIASRRWQYSATQQPQATARHTSSFAVSRLSSDWALPTVCISIAGGIWRRHPAGKCLATWDRRPPVERCPATTGRAVDSGGRPRSRSTGREQRGGPRPSG